MITFSRYDSELKTDALVTVGVLATVETHVNQSVQIMSDVWDTQRVVTFLANPRALQYGGKLRWATHTTSLYEFPDKSFAYELDATPEVAHAWAAHLANVARVERENAARKLHAERAATARAQAATIRRGSYVTVVKGRKVPRGTAGEVVWVGDGNYGMRVGLVDINGDVHWTAYQNCRLEALTPESFRRANPVLASGRPFKKEVAA